MAILHHWNCCVGSFLEFDEIMQEPITKETIKVDFIWLEHGKGLQIPKQQSHGAAGFDIRAALLESETITIKPGEYEFIPSGFCIALIAGYEAQIRPRSGLAAKFGITVLNSPGTIDADYRGEVKIMLINHGKKDFIIKRGDRIAQMVIAPISLVEFELCESLDETKRGAGGFGSTG